MHVTMKANAVHMHSKLLLTSSGREGVGKAAVFLAHALRIWRCFKGLAESKDMGEFIFPLGEAQQ